MYAAGPPVHQILQCLYSLWLGQGIFIIPPRNPHVQVRAVLSQFSKFDQGGVPLLAHGGGLVGGEGVREGGQQEGGKLCAVLATNR